MEASTTQTTAVVQTTTISRSEVHGVALALAALTACFSVHCSRCGTETPPAPSASVVVPAPPAAPRGFVADFVVPRPATLWGALREILGARFPVLPREGALAVVHGLGLPLATAGLFELESPMLGVLTRDTAGSVTPTAAIRLKSGRELVALLTTGATPPFAGETSASGITELVPRGTEAAYGLAVFRNHLVVSRDREQARQNARFLVEVVAQRPPPDAAGVLTARQPQLKGPLLEALRSRWREYEAELRASEAAARRERGRPPDFADPEAVLTSLNAGVEALLAVVASSREITLSARFFGGDLVLGVEALPEASGAARDLVNEQVVGSVEPLRDLTADTALAVLSHSRRAARVRAASDVGLWLERVFGARLGQADQARVAELFEQFARGRGDHTVLALVLGDSPAVLAQGALGDARELEAALTGLPSLLKIEAIAKPLTHFLGPVRSGPVRSPPGAPTVRGYTLSFGPRGALQELAPAGLSVFWSTTDRAYRTAIGGAAAVGHVRAAPTRTLAVLPGAPALFERLGEASFVVIARPALLGLMPDTSRSNREPLVSISAGSRGDKGFVNTVISNEVIRYYAGPERP